jgi:hypothetical protein
MPAFHIAEPPRAETAATPAAGTLLRRLRWPLAFAAFAAAAAAMVVWLAPPASPFDDLWRPFAETGKPVLICLPSPDVVEVRGSSAAAYQSADRKDFGTPDPGDIRVMREFYVGRGAAYGAALLARLFARRGQTFSIKAGRDVSFPDLRNQPAVVLGGPFASRWGNELTQGLRFRTMGDLKAQTATIRDSQDPSRVWTESLLGDPGTRRAYSSVARIMNSVTGQVAITLAGITPSGTESAVEFVTSPQSFAGFVRVAPADWRRRSFQVVLESDVYEHTPGPPKVVAWHVW